MAGNDFKRKPQQSPVERQAFKLRTEKAKQVGWIGRPILNGLGAAIEQGRAIAHRSGGRFEEGQVGLRYLSTNVLLRSLGLSVSSEGVELNPLARRSDSPEEVLDDLQNEDLVLPLSGSVSTSLLNIRAAGDGSRIEALLVQEGAWDALARDMHKVRTRYDAYYDQDALRTGRLQLGVSIGRISFLGHSHDHVARIDAAAAGMPDIGPVGLGPVLHVAPPRSGRA